MIRLFIFFTLSGSFLFNQSLEEADRLFLEGKYHKVVDVYKQVGIKNLNFKQLKMLGSAAISIGDTAQAIQAWDESIAMKPDSNCGVMMVLGQLYYVKKDFDKALTYFDKKLEVQACDDESSNVRALKYSALAHLQKANLKGVTAKVKASNLNEAKNLIASALVTYGNNADLYLTLGDVYVGLGDEDQTSANYYKALDIALSDTSDADNQRIIGAAYQKLVGIYYKKKSWNNVVELGKKWAENSSSFGPPLYVAIGYQNLYIVRGSSDESLLENACKWYKRVLGINPNQITARKFIDGGYCNFDLTDIKVENSKKHEKEKAFNYQNSKNTILEISRIFNFLNKSSQGEFKILFDKKLVRVKLLKENYVFYDDFFYNLNEDDFFYYTNGQISNHSEKVDCFNVRTYSDMVRIFEKGWSSFLGGYAKTGDEYKAKMEFEEFKTNNYNNYLNYLEALDIKSNKDKRLSMRLQTLRRQLVAEKHSSFDKFLEEEKLKKNNKPLSSNVFYLLNYKCVTLNHKIKPEEVMEFYKLGMISELSVEEYVQVNDYSQLSKLFTAHIISSWESELVNDPEEDYIPFTRITIPNFDPSSNFLHNYEPNIDSKDLSQQFLTSADKTKLIETLKRLLNKKHNEALTKRKEIIKKLEIGDFWNGGFIEEFNPSKTKIKIRINRTNAPDQLKWVDLK